MQLFLKILVLDQQIVLFTLKGLLHRLERLNLGTARVDLAYLQLILLHCNHLLHFSGRLLFELDEVFVCCQDLQLQLSFPRLESLLEVLAYKLSHAHDEPSLPLGLSNFLRTFF